jgi:hypothetical protein
VGQSDRVSRQARLVDDAAAGRVDAAIGSRVAGSTTSGHFFRCTQTPGLEPDEFRAAVRMHTHTPERECYGAALGTPCKLCTRPLRAGHHRVCRGAHRGTLTESHHAVRDAIVALINETAGLSAVTERMVAPIFDTVNGTGEVHHVRADIVILGWNTPGGAQRVWEIKTYDPRCDTWRGVAPAAADALIRERGLKQYSSATHVDVIVVGADGTIAPKTRAILNELIELRAEEGVVAGAVCADVFNAIMAALARCEARSYAAWSAEYARVTCVLAQAAATDAVLARGDGAGEGAVYGAAREDYTHVHTSHVVRCTALAA